MRLIGKQGEPKPLAAWIVLTTPEAWDLKVAPDYFFDEPSGPGWHHHAGDPGNEVTIEIEVVPDAVEGSS